MRFKACTALVLCFSQIVLGFQGPAGKAPARSAEFDLLENMIVLQGTVMSQDELKTRVTQLLNDYTKTAQSEGRLDRLQSAMVDLGVSTPAQASALIVDAREAAQKNADVSEALKIVLSRQTAGAQFSWCVLGGGVLLGVSAFVVFLGLAINGLADGSPSFILENPVFDLGLAGVGGAIFLIVKGANGDC